MGGWQGKVPTIEIDSHMHAVTQSDVVAPTMDTVRHEELYSRLSEHKPLMLCGPPGSGKTMTLFSGTSATLGLQLWRLVILRPRAGNTSRSSRQLQLVILRLTRQMPSVRREGSLDWTSRILVPDMLSSTPPSTVRLSYGHAVTSTSDELLFSLF